MQHLNNVRSHFIGDVPDNVKEFAIKCSKIIGRHKSFHYCVDYGSYCKKDVSSPIEQLFLAASDAIREVMGGDDGSIVHEGVLVNYGTSILPQFEIGRYRVDFLLQHKTPEMIRNGERMSTLVVECDGHCFHERSEKDRRYEKTRDRYLQGLGHKVIHFTGSEIVENPFNPAIEAYAMLTGEDVGFILTQLNWHQE